MEFKVDGMTCGHCAGAVTKAVKQLDGGAEVKVDLAAGRVSVRSNASAQALSAAISEAGYPAKPA